MSSRDEHDERECMICGLLVSDCVCDEFTRAPSPERLERERRERLTRAELVTEISAGGAR
jgi:hypothetical protein